MFHIAITISSILILLLGCSPTLHEGNASARQDIAFPKVNERTHGVYKSITLQTPLGPITEEERQKTKERVEFLYDKLKNEVNEDKKKIIKLEWDIARTNYYELLPIPYREEVPQAGQGVTIAAIDSGVLGETIQHLGSKFIGYHEMAPDYSISEKTIPQLHLFKFFASLDSRVVEIVSKHGDDVVRFMNRIAPDANIMCINNYKKEYKVKIGGSEFSKRFYDAPLGITKSIKYILDNAKPSSPLIINIAEGVSHFRRNLNKKAISEMKRVFKQAYDKGIIIIVSAGNMTDKPEDSYKLGLNPGLNCPWVIPAGAVDHKNNALRTRYDHTDRSKVLYVLSSFIIRCSG